MLSKPNKPKVLQKFGGFEVYENGDIVGVDGFEITFDRLNECDWWGFLLANGYNMNDFLQSYFLACKTAKIDSITIKII